MKTYHVELEGISPLLMHSAQGLNPTHPLRKEAAKITGKRGTKKTDADLAALDFIDFQLAIYHDGKRPFVPDLVIEAAIRDGAKAERKGKDVVAAVTVTEEEIPLVYDGPTSIQGLYDKGFVDRRRATVQRNGVMRTRPCFRAWVLDFDILIDESVINPGAVKEALDYAGLKVGICDFRPRFGRFKVTAWKENA